MASAKAGASGVRRKEGGRGAMCMRDEDDIWRPELRFVVPEVLKMMLVDDWEAVMKSDHELVTLPQVLELSVVLTADNIDVSFRQRLARRRVIENLPPRPKGWPLIGNLFDIPKHSQWLAYADWAREYGSPLIHVNLLGTHFMVANDMATAKDLLDKKGSNFNLRPRLPMLNEAMASSLILDMVYGMKVKSEDDEFVAYANNSQKGIDRCFDGWAVEFFPWLQRLPSWLPGMGWKKQTDEWKCDALSMLNAPYEWFKGELGQGRATQCVATELLDDYNGDAIPKTREYIIKSICATAYLGSADTTVVYLKAFILAMLLFPEVQQRAHDELDRVVGDARLPEFSDETALPYISALVKEVLRWGTIAPLGMPHVSAEDDVYKGYFIPKGTAITWNTWAFMNDPSTYPEPDKVRPERFLTASGQLDTSVQGPDAVFGFGRRICPPRSEQATRLIQKSQEPPSA
ncbi:cytochrome P450 [Amylostereum chailletii]|nr:cytochrome P450 [Amylostereum chailletii]